MKRASLSRLLPVASLLLVAAVLRTWDLNRVFLDPDEAIWMIVPLKLFRGPLLRPGPLEQLPLAQLAAWPYGYLYPLILTAWVGVLHGTGLGVTERLMLLPCAAMGVGSVFLVYRLVREEAGRDRALLACGLAAVLPLHVGLSRSMIATRIPASFFLLLFLLCFLRYLRRRGTRDALFSGLALAGYSTVTPMFPAVAPVMAGAAFLYTDAAGGAARRTGRAVRALLRREIVLPPLLALAPPLAVLVYGIGIGNLGGQLGYILAKPKTPGLYLAALAGYFTDNAGTALAWLAPPALVYGIVVARRSRWHALLVLWSVVYLAPFAFFLRENILPREYLLDGTLPVVILSAGMVADLIGVARRRSGVAATAWAAITVPALVVATFVATLQSVFGLQPDGTVVKQPFRYVQLGDFGMQRRDNGVKAAGYYVRRTVPPETGVFTDMTPFHGPLYFGREVYAVSDGNEESMLDYLAKIRDRIGAAVVNRIGERRVRDVLGPAFHRVAVIRRGGEPVMAVYATGKTPPVELHVEEANRRYEREFRRARQILPPGLDYPELTPVQMGVQAAGEE